MSNQLNLFPVSTSKDITKKSFTKTDLTNETIDKLSNYDLNMYTQDIKTLGLFNTWNIIYNYITQFKNSNNLLNLSNLGDLYELGLAIKDKMQKKATGQYYTPNDVANVMAQWLYSGKGENICDVGCGTGQLILAYLELIGKENALNLIHEGKIYLYDIDYLALQICKTSIMVKYSIKDNTLIHDTHCDFLCDNIKLPKNSKVISNPPYAAIKEFDTNWKQTNILLDTKELYAAFMEKIITQSESSVIISPFSFISGNKFFSLRKKMSDTGTGFIIAFDNVPGNIFCGKKQGIFNTNTANSVRAAITIFNKNTKEKGFKIAPLIRFKHEERNKLLRNNVLESVLPENLQTIDKNNTAFKKINKDLENIFYAWEKKSEYKLKDIISKEKTDYLIDMPNTCRYFTTGSHRKLKRTGSIELYIKEKKFYNFLYCFINSSFTYWWWRIYDGGITYSKSLLLNIPLPLNLLSRNDEIFFENICNKMIQEEDNHIITKLNAGVIQENIKFPEKYRNEINKKILSIIGFNVEQNIFSKIHANYFTEAK